VQLTPLFQSPRIFTTSSSYGRRHRRRKTSTPAADAVIDVSCPSLLSPHPQPLQRHPAVRSRHLSLIFTQSTRVHSASP
ncbi:hypothetical protein CRENBAI_019480, partial [Crenichthys baileyi]